MEKHILTYVQRYPKTSAAGKPYVSMVIKTNAHGDKTLSGFGNKENESWKPGDEVEFNVVQKDQYLNFEVPRGAGGRGGAVDEHLKARIEQIYTEVYNIRQSVVMLTQLLRDKGAIPPSQGYDYPDEPNEPPPF